PASKFQKSDRPTPLPTTMSSTVVASEKLAIGAEFFQAETICAAEPVFNGSVQLGLLLGHAKSSAPTVVATRQTPYARLIVPWALATPTPNASRAKVSRSIFFMF